MRKIKVYYFTKYDIIVGKSIRSKTPATLEAIAAVRGVAIKETKQEVDASRVDGTGFLSAE